MENYSPKVAMKTMRIIHIAMAALPTLFGIVVAALNLTDPNQSEAGFPTDFQPGIEILLYVPAIVLVLALPMSTFLFKQNIKSNLGEEPTLRSKLAAFQSAHLVRMAFIEMAGLLAVVVCFITGNLYNLAVLLTVLLIFLNKMPSVYSIKTELGLTPEEKSSFQD